MRAKRYYVKKHLLILQKRKLRRYILKVKKIIADKKYDAAAVKIDLDESCNQYKTRDNKTVSYNDILHAVDLAREDRYLSFLNQDAQIVLNSLPTKDNDDNNNNNNNNNNTEEEQEQQDDPTRIEKLMANLANKHSGRLFQLTTLWSAYLLLYHVENEYQEKGLALNEKEKLEKIEATCLDYYEIDYSHLKGEELPDNLMNPELYEEEQVEKETDKQEKEEEEEETNRIKYTKKNPRSSCAYQKDTEQQVEELEEVEEEEEA